MDKTFKFICCGNVDDGKSTLIGRILLDTGNIKKDQIEEIKEASVKLGSSKIELSTLLDGLLAERTQQITIDVAHRYFDYKNIRFHILDCPGHKQYTKNMAIAAAEVNTAVVVIDVTKGIQEQTKKHIDICALFNIKNICVCLTKCDLIVNSKNKLNYNKINRLNNDLEKLLSTYNFTYDIIPISAHTGYNINKFLKKLYSLAKKDNNKTTNCIIHILSSQLYKKERYYYGIESTNTKPITGTKYLLFPNNIPITIKSTPIHGCFTIKENVDITKGDCITNCPIIISNIIKHKTIWFDPPTENMLIKHGSRVGRIINYSADTLELDTDLLFNNIEDIKQNSLGIIIDATSKKTIGCSIFTGNNINESKNKISPKIYFINSNIKLLKENYFENISKLPNIILDCNKLKNTVFSNTDNLVLRIYSFAKILREQGFNIYIICNKQLLKCIIKDTDKDTIILSSNNME